MAECRRVEIRPNVLKKYVDYLSRPESQAALLHEIVYENGYVMAPMLRRAFDRTTAELAVRYAGEGAQMSSSGMLKLNQSIPGTRRSKSIEPLVSPRRYAASIRSLVLAEDEMTLMEKNPPCLRSTPYCPIHRPIHARKSVLLLKGKTFLARPESWNK